MERYIQALGGDGRLGRVLQLAREDLRTRRPDLQLEDFRIARWQKTLLNRVCEVEVVDRLNPLTLFVKLAESGSDSDLAREAQNIALFRRYFSTSHAKFQVVEAVGHYPEVDALVVIGCRGRCLLESITDTCRWFRRGSTSATTRQMAQSLGEWLRFLEVESLNSGDAGEVRDRMLREAENAVQRLAELGTSASKALVETCRRTIQQTVCARDAAVYMAHGDLHPGNVFVSDAGEGSVSVIDLRLARPHFVGYDALYFEHQLTHSFGPIRFNPGAIREIIEAFRRGYGRRLEPSSPMTSGMRAHLVLDSLVYLSTLARSGTLLRKILCRVDTRTLARSLPPSFAGETAEKL